MLWNLEELCKALNANVDETIDANNSARFFLRFNDKKLRYYCDIQTDIDVVVFAADFEEPLQAAPLFEFSFNCTIIDVGVSPYVTYPSKSIFFYAYKNTQDGVRLSLTPRPDGIWYFWANTWKSGVHESTLAFKPG